MNEAPLLRDLEDIDRVVNSTFNDRGAIAWWHRPRAQLDGRTPTEAWLDGDRQAVLDLAYALLEGNAT